ncbi:nucleotide exchange factor GrpE [Candidatus Vidania fulgoroideorum]
MKQKDVKNLKKENIFLKKRCNDIMIEFEKIKKRFSIENEKIKKYSCTNLIKNIIPIVDSLEITFRNALDQNTKDGISITLKIIKNNLKKNNVKKINPKKYEKFNPFLHQAILKIKKPKKPNLVFNVLQKGYKIADKVIRPALVSVTSEY